MYADSCFAICRPSFLNLQASASISAGSCFSIYVRRLLLLYM
jgi:hypothetical protein